MDYTAIINNGLRDTLSRAVGPALFAPMMRAGAQTELAETLDKYATSMLLDGVEASKRRTKVVVSQCLDANAQAMMVDLYPQYQIVNTETSAGPHGLAANLRRLETQLVIDLMGGKTDFIDIGGNYVSHLARGRAVHCCAPGLAIRDSARRTERTLQLNSMLDPLEVARLKVGSLKHSARHLFQSSPESFVCHKRGQDCDVPSRKQCYIHSTYDIPFDDLGLIMNAHSSDLAVGTFLFPVDALLANEGTCQSHRFEFVVDEKKDEISFAFDGDSSLNYVHRWSELRKYVKNCVIKRDGSTFLYEIIDIRGSACFFKITRCASDVTLPREVLQHRVWLASMEHKTVIMCPTLADFNVRNDYDNVVMTPLVVPKVLFEVVYGWMTSHDKAVKWGELVRYARSANTRVVLNGRTITVPESIDHGDILRLCSALSLILMKEDIVRQRTVGEAEKIVKYELGMNVPMRIRRFVVRNLVLIGASVVSFRLARGKFRSFGPKMVRRMRERRNVPLMSRIINQIKYDHLDKPLDQFARQFDPCVRKMQISRLRRWTGRATLVEELNAARYNARVDLVNMSRFPMWLTTQPLRLSAQRISDMEGMFHVDLCRLVPGLVTSVLPVALMRPVIEPVARATCNWLRKKLRRDVSGKIPYAECAKRFLTYSEKHGLIANDDEPVPIVVPEDSRDIEQKARDVIECSSPVDSSNLSADLDDIIDELDTSPIVVEVESEDGGVNADSELGDEPGDVESAMDVANDGVDTTAIDQDDEVDIDCVQEDENGNLVINIFDTGEVKQEETKGSPLVIPPLVNVKKDRADEIDAVNNILRPMGKVLRDVAGDGNCLFRAISVLKTATENSHRIYRLMACDFIDEHPEIVTFTEVESGASMRRDGVWGGTNEIVALTNVLNEPIFVFKREEFDTVPGKLSLYYTDSRTHFMAIVDIVEGGAASMEERLGAGSSGRTTMNAPIDVVAEDAAIKEYVKSMIIQEVNTVKGYQSWWDRMVRRAEHQNTSMQLSNNMQRSEEELVYARVSDVKAFYCRGVVDGKVVNLDEVYEEQMCLTGNGLIYPDPKQRIALAKEMINVHNISDRHVFLGVAGCGKTHTILNAARSDALMCSPLRDSVAEFKKEVVAKNIKTFVDIRTVDSILHNHRTIGAKYRGVDELWVDEAYNVHSGAVHVLERFIGASKTIWAGDDKQIPPVNATSLVWRNYKTVTGSIVTSDITWRCPADAAAFMTSRYGRKVKTNVGRMQGYSVHKISSVEQVPIVKGATYMAMYNHEVDELKARGISNVKKVDVNNGEAKAGTTHYFQGKTASNVILVRLGTYDKTLYSDIGYINVALTRHTESCKYYTVNTRDDISKAMEKAVAAVGSGRMSEFMTGVARDKFNVIGGSDSIDPSMCIVPADETVKPPQITNDFEESTLDIVCSRNGNYVKVMDEVAGDTYLEDRNVDLSLNDVPEYTQPEIAMQMFIDEKFPGHSVSDNTYDLSSVQYSDLHLDIHGKCRIGLEGDEAVKLDKEILEPVLRNLKPQDARQTLKETLIAYAKRNANIPNTRVPLDEAEFQSEVWSRAIKNLFGKKWEKKTRQFNESKLTITRDSLTEWWNKQDEGKKKALKAMADTPEGIVLGSVSLDHMEIMIKDKRKPMMNMKAQVEYPASQTLTFSGKDVNCLFGGIVATLHHRLLKILKPNVCMVTDKSDADFTRFLRRFMSKSRDFLEIDISKFDKSQLEELLDLEMFIYGQLGLDNAIAEIYKVMYDEVQVDSFKVAFRCYLEGQRKSGAPTTLFGNSIINMFCLNYALDIGDFDFAAFKGDDSIYQRPKGNIDYSKLELHCNFDAKPIVSPVPYFCSCYIVMNSDGEPILMPDPIKRIESFSDNGMKSEEQLADKYESMKDLMYNYRDPVARENLADSVEVRFNESYQTLRGAIGALCTATSNYGRFRAMWASKPTYVHY